MKLNLVGYSSLVHRCNGRVHVGGRDGEDASAEIYVLLNRKNNQTTKFVK